jgi:hypothetical protein
MRPSLSQSNQFLSGQLLPGVRLHHNDYVRVVSGEHVDDAGSVISVDNLGPDPTLLVELDSNSDALILQSALELVTAASASRESGV